jgi:omega-amidase
MKVACIQYNIVWENQEKNFLLVERLVKELIKKKPQLVLLPELFSTGVTLNSIRFEEDINGKTCTFLSGLAKKFKIYVLGSFVEKQMKKKPKNSVVVFNPEGKLICKYQKNHVFTYGGENRSYSDGEGITNFRIGKFLITPLICYDLRFPEIFRKAIDNGTNIFVIPANWPNPRKEHWITLLKARAIENQSYIIGINRVGNSPTLSFFGNSLIVSPKGDIINQAGSKEQVIISDLDIEEVTNFRSIFPTLRDRKDNHYCSFVKNKRTTK